MPSTSAARRSTTSVPTLLWLPNDHDDDYGGKAEVNVLDLFSGLGAFSYGLERAGMRTVAFCEIDPYCRRVLARHWPDVRCYDDVCQLDPAGIDADGICGGFPCQNV